MTSNPPKPRGSGNGAARPASSAARNTRVEREKRVVRRMTAVYCRHKEGNAEICDSCREFADYACQRLDHCRYGDTKPPCRRCPAHCYSPAMRERIRRVMRYAWPRELMRAPLSALRHMF